MLVYLNHEFARPSRSSEEQGRELTIDDLRQALTDGALMRVPSIVMTAAAIVGARLLTRHSGLH